jgi:3-oxoacyl-[acyl-carrier protein] reductase
MSGVLLITGTRKGLGRHLADHYLAQGWRVAGCSRGEATVQHANYTHFQLDVANEPAVVAMVHAVVEQHGQIDALINNAGIASMNHLLLTPQSSARSVLDVNFLGTFLFLREAAKAMVRQKKGRIVNFSTVAVPLQLEGEAIYAASKAAVETLTRTAAREFGAFGITVNAIGPTPVPTDLIKTVPKPKLDALVARQAIRRFGEPRDVINVVDFFLRPESDFITGQIVYLGGVSG